MEWEGIIEMKCYIQCEPQKLPLTGSVELQGSPTGGQQQSLNHWPHPHLTEYWAQLEHC